MKKKKKRVIKVSAPIIPTLRPEEAIKKAQQKDLEEERFRVLELSRRIGRKIGPIPVIVGAFLLITSGYLFIRDSGLSILMAPEIKVFFIVLFSFLGVINVVTGLLLMSD